MRQLLKNIREVNKVKYETNNYDGAQKYYSGAIMWIRLCWHATHVDKYTLAEHFKILRYIVAHANKGGNVKIESYGKENIPKEDGFMFFPNHQGMYDAGNYRCLR